MGMPGVLFSERKHGNKLRNLAEKSRLFIAGKGFK
jgi:hypothetical protein